MYSVMDNKLDSFFFYLISVDQNISSSFVGFRMLGNASTIYINEMNHLRSKLLCLTIHTSCLDMVVLILDN